MLTMVKNSVQFKRKMVLESIIEKGVKGPASINAGIYLFNRRIFQSLKSIEKSVRGELELTDALKLNEIYTVNYLGFWKDIGSPWDLLTANEVCIDIFRAMFKE